MGKKLTRFINRAQLHSGHFRARLDEAGIAVGDIQSTEDLLKIPVMKKEELPGIQKGAYPFGDIALLPANEMARIFLSPGPIYDPQSFEGDFWRFSEALRAAGFDEEDIVLNTFSYHLSPAGFMFDSGLRALGATVVPAGPGNKELQLQIMRDGKVTGYTGTPSFLAMLLEAAEEKGWQIGEDIVIRKAFFTAEKVTADMRDLFSAKGITVYEGYGTADCGCIAYEDGAGEGLKVASDVVVQICDPVTGKETDGSEGELVVTLFDDSYPLIRFGTGDLSRWVEGREGERIAGILGRVSDGVKVKGMFVHERQLTETLASAGYPDYKAVVTRENHQDHLTIFLETDTDPKDRLIEDLKEILRVRPTLKKAPPGTLNIEQNRLVDER